MRSWLNAATTGVPAASTPAAAPPCRGSLRSGSMPRATAPFGWRQQHGARFDTPPAGLFGWVDAGVDTEALAQRLLDHGWLTAPGHLFYPERRTSTCMRINFAATQDASFGRHLREWLRVALDPPVTMGAAGRVVRTFHAVSQPFEVFRPAAR